MALGVCERCTALQIVTDEARLLPLKPATVGQGTWYARCRLDQRHPRITRDYKACDGMIRPIPDETVQAAMEAAYVLSGVSGARAVLTAWQQDQRGKHP